MRAKVSQSAGHELDQVALTVGFLIICDEWLSPPDRRVAAWGAMRANWIYFKVGVRWGLGFRKGLERHYPDVR